MLGSVASFGGRFAICAAMFGITAGAVISTTGDAEARSRRSHYRAVKPTPAAAFTGGSNYAALVVDAKTGRTLYEKNADAIRFPASVTKVMTLYLVFEDLERGRIKLDTELTMSARCAAAAPSKLYIRPGQTISVEDGVKALVTKSANDVACAFGDNLEGSEAAFADRMTRKARAIGMSRSVFYNASGLPNPNHVTTARDLVTLGRAIQDRYPRYYGYFGTRVFAWGRQRIGNHNRLLGRVEGVDGIKTGYTNASGFNLLSSVKSQGRSVVAVVMGGRTGASRDAHMRELLALNLPKAQPGSRTAPLIADAGDRAAPAGARPAVMSGVPMPLAAPRVPTSERIASLDAETAVPVPAPAPRREIQPVREAQFIPVSSGATPRAQRVVEAEAPVEAASVPVVDPAPAKRAPAAAAPQPMRWVVGNAPAVTGSVRDAQDEPSAIAELAEAPVEKPVKAAHPVVEREAAPLRKGWLIQIGATTEVAAAEALLSNARAKGGRTLGAAEPYTETYTKGSTTYYRARFAGLDEKSADAACKTLKRSSVSCFAIKN